METDIINNINISIDENIIMENCNSGNNNNEENNRSEIISDSTNKDIINNNVQITLDNTSDFNNTIDNNKYINTIINTEEEINENIKQLDNYYSIKENNNIDNLNIINEISDNTIINNLENNNNNNNNITNDNKDLNNNNDYKTIRNNEECIKVENENNQNKKENTNNESYLELKFSGLSFENFEIFIKEFYRIYNSGNATKLNLLKHLDGNAQILFLKYDNQSKTLEQIIHQLNQIFQMVYNLGGSGGNTKNDIDRLLEFPKKPRFSSLELMISCFILINNINVDETFRTHIFLNSLPPSLRYEVSILSPSSIQETIIKTRLVESSSIKCFEYSLYNEKSTSTTPSINQNSDHEFKFTRPKRFPFDPLINLNSNLLVNNFIKSISKSDLIKLNLVEKDELENEEFINEQENVEDNTSEDDNFTDSSISEELNISNEHQSSVVQPYVLETPSKTKQSISKIQKKVTTLETPLQQEKSPKPESNLKNPPTDQPQKHQLQTLQSISLPEPLKQPHTPDNKNQQPQTIHPSTPIPDGSEFQRKLVDWRSNSDNSRITQVFCFYCKIPGHKINQCRKKIFNEKNNRNNNRNNIFNNNKINNNNNNNGTNNGANNNNQ